jgi:hypothetical protein
MTYEIWLVLAVVAAWMFLVPGRHCFCRKH